jgi:exonuclease VII large subunit
MTHSVPNNLKEIDDLPTDTTQRSEDNEQQAISAMQRYSSSSLMGVFNGKQRNLIKKALASELELGFEHRHKAIDMALETRLHSIREACNHVLVTGKTHLRQQRLEYFGEALSRVEKRMGELADDFLQEADQRYQRLEGYSSDAIREREKQRLEKSVNSFLSTLDSLMDEFSSIIHEHIDHTKAT